MKVNFQATLKFKRDEIGIRDANLFAAAFKDFRDGITWFFRFGSKEDDLNRLQRRFDGRDPQ